MYKPPATYNSKLLLIHFLLKHSFCTNHQCTTFFRWETLNMVLKLEATEGQNNAVAEQCTEGMLRMRAMTYSHFAYQNRWPWSWRPIIHFVTLCSSLSQPITKIWMKIDPYYQRRKCTDSAETLVCDHIKVIQIFVGFSWIGGIKWE